MTRKIFEDAQWLCVFTPIHSPYFGDPMLIFFLCVLGFSTLMFLISCYHDFKRKKLLDDLWSKENELARKEQELCEQHDKIIDLERKLVTMAKGIDSLSADNCFLQRKMEIQRKALIDLDEDRNKKDHELKHLWGIIGQFQEENGTIIKTLLNTKETLTKGLNNFNFEFEKFINFFDIQGDYLKATLQTKGETNGQAN